MTAVERVAAAFECRPTDRVPVYQAGFSASVASQILGREAYVGGGRAQFLEACVLWQGKQAHQEYLERCWADAVELCRKLELDIVRTRYWRMPERPTRRIDEHTFFYGDPEGQWRVMRHDPVTELYQIVDASPRPEPTLADLERQVEAMEESAQRYEPGPEAFADIKRVMDEFGEDGVPYSGVPVGMCVPREAVWLEAVALAPGLVRRFLDCQAEHAVRNVRAARAEGLRYCYGGGDFASNKGPFYSPQAFQELMVPGLTRISEACEEAGAFHGFASDGNLWPIADDLFGTARVSFFYEVDCKAGMGLERLRRTYPHLTLLGGINSETLHRGAVEEVIAETREAMRVAEELGGCIVGCSNQIVAGTPMANFWSMMDTLNEMRGL